MRQHIQLWLGVVVQVLAISCWFNTAAVTPGIAREYGLADGEAVGLTAAVQAGFAVGALVVGVLRLSDRIEPRWIISGGALAAAVLTVLPVALETGFFGFVASRIGVGVALGAVYPTGMRTVVSWAAERHRALAVAALVAALTVGTAAPHLLTGSVVDRWRDVLVVTAGAATLASVLALLTKPGPQVAAVRRVTLREAFATLTDRVQRRITLGYFGHQWEVYGLWVWLPALLMTLPVLGDVAADDRAGVVGLWSFALIAVGGILGCVVGGLLPLYFGKRRSARAILVVSALCAICVPLLGSAPFWLAIAVLALWNAAAIADSALYSSMTGDRSGGAAVGTALAVQMALGYAVSIAAIYAVPMLAEFTEVRWALLILALGPIASLFAMTDPARRTRTPPQRRT